MFGTNNYSGGSFGLSPRRRPPWRLRALPGETKQRSALPVPVRGGYQLHFGNPQKSTLSTLVWGREEDDAKRRSRACERKSSSVCFRVDFGNQSPSSRSSRTNVANVGSRRRSRPVVAAFGRCSIRRRRRQHPCEAEPEERRAVAISPIRPQKDNGMAN